MICRFCEGIRAILPTAETCQQCGHLMTGDTCESCYGDGVAINSPKRLLEQQQQEQVDYDYERHQTTQTTNIASEI